MAVIPNKGMGLVRTRGQEHRSSGSMTRIEPLIRKQYLQQLQPFCRHLAKSLAEKNLSAEQAREVWRDAVSGQCARCGIQISGEELQAISQPPSLESASAKTGRLRLGDCARQGCDSAYYSLRFEPSFAVDWAQILDDVDHPQQVQPAREGPIRAWEWLKLVLWRSKTARHIFLGLLVIAGLLLVRQWYIGGSIPWIREPERFYGEPWPPTGKP